MKDYAAEVKDGEKHGQGTDTQADRMKYVGETKNGKYHGQGTKTWPDGTKYVGQFKDGEARGQGTYTYADGTKYVGEYKDAVEWKGTEYDTNGNVLATWSEGVRKPPSSNRLSKHTNETSSSDSVAGVFYAVDDYKYSPPKL